MKLADLGEFGFIERIRRAAGGAAGVRIGIGDDCALVDPRPGMLLLTTTDMLIEEVHFRREWTDLRRLGRKSVAVNVSDIAAMGGSPRCLYLGLGIPAHLEVAELDAFLEGFLESAGEYGAALVGGDTCRSPGPLIISVTAEGEVPEGEVVRRSGARAGDLIYVSGTLGDSALALRQLQAGLPLEPFLAGRHHDPRARAGLGRALAAAGLASAMIDLSDGLLADLRHLLVASGVGARLEVAALPLSPAFRRSLQADSSLLPLALSGGEDYELLFAVRPDREPQLRGLAKQQDLALTRIGILVPPDGGGLIRDLQGKELTGNGGFDHFRALD